MLRIPSEVYELMVEHALYEWPHECCGVLAFCQGEPAIVYRARNIAPEAHHTYELHPEDQLHIFNEMARHEFTLGAIYHSHPTTQPIPSQTDLDKMNYPDALCIIIGLADAKVL